MAVDTQSSQDTDTSDYSVVTRPPRGSQLPQDAKLMPTCMLWSMIVGLGFIVLVVLVWAISNIGHLHFFS